MGDTAGELSCLQEVTRLKPYYYNGVRKICGICENRKLCSRKNGLPR
jgi:hypothetical protein